MTELVTSLAGLNQVLFESTFNVLHREGIELLVQVGARAPMMDEAWMRRPYPEERGVWALEDNSNRSLVWRGPQWAVVLATVEADETAASAELAWGRIWARAKRDEEWSQAWLVVHDGVKSGRRDVRARLRSWLKSNTPKKMERTG